MKIEKNRRLILLVAGLVGGLILLVISFSGSSRRDPMQTILVEEKGKKLAGEGRTRELMARGYFEEAKVSFQSKNFAQAREAIEKLLALEPNQPEAVKFKQELEKADKEFRQGKTASLQEEIRNRELMQKVERGMNGGDRLTARLILHQILEENPRHEPAKLLLKKMEVDEEGEKTALIRKGQEERETRKKAETLLQEAGSLESSGKTVEAYRLFQEVTTLLKKVGPSPLLSAFSTEADQGEKRLHDRLLKEMEPRYQVALRKGQEAKGSSEPASKVQLYHEAADLVGSLTPPQLPVGLPRHAGAEKLQQEIFEALNELAQPFYIKAKTLDELETCNLAIPGYRKTMEIARYEAVPLYRLSREAVQNCK